MNTQLHNKVSIETHGCKLNQADSGKLALEFIEAGFELVENGQPTNTHIINTCTVTHVADRKARRSLRAAKRQNPDATIVATGCYVDRDEKSLLEIPEIDIVANNANKATLVGEIIASQGDEFISCTLGTDQVPINMRAIRTRASVKIQEGCDQVCAYCIVPRVRGRERSIPADKLVTGIQNLENIGYKEIILTGTQLGTYGFDISRGPNKLHLLIEHILQNTTVERLRVSSVQPQEINSDLLKVWENPRVCPHMHIPLQSGSDVILKTMRRRYTRIEYLNAIAAVKSKFSDFSLSTDIIVGFPGESKKDHLDTVDIVNNVDFSKLHVFPFSVRPGTTAAHLNDQVDSTIKSIRVNELISLGDEKSRSYRKQMIGTIRPVLWEERKNLGWEGLTDNYVRVCLDDERPLYNKITQVLIEEEFNGYLNCLPID